MLDGKNKPPTFPLMYGHPTHTEQQFPLGSEGSHSTEFRRQSTRFQREGDTIIRTLESMMTGRNGAILEDRLAITASHVGKTKAYGIAPPARLLYKWQTSIPRDWIGKVLPIAKVVGQNCLYVNDGKGSNINIHLMSSKEIYKVFTAFKPKQLTCKDK